MTLLERAHEEGAVYGSKAVGEPPLMLAFSVREALREAAAAFGPAGTSVDLGSPATPEAVWWALTRLAGDTTRDTWSRESPARIRTSQIPTPRAPTRVRGRRLASPPMTDA